MTATDAQVRIIMRERQNGRTQEQAAAKANLRSRRTVRKYERLGKLPSELEKPREYRTRSDPFEEHWAEAEAMLADVPELRNVSMILRHFSSEFSEQYYRSHAVDMWTTAKRHSCPHTHSDYDFPFFFGGLIQTASGN